MMASAAAMQTFNPRLGFAFDTYAVHRMRAWIVQALRMESLSERYGYRSTSGNAPLPGDDGASFFDLIGQCHHSSLDDSFEAIRLAIQAAVRQHVLSKRWRDMFSMVYGLDGRPPMKIREVGRVFGVSRQAVQHICKRVKEKILPYQAAIYDQHVQ